MSYIIRTYACDGAGKGEPHTFEIMIERDQHPKFCPECGAKIGNIETVPTKIAIGGKPITKAVDGTYRAIEESSAARAEKFNNPGLKITNMKDRLREGDSAAIMPQNSVTSFIEEARRRGVEYGWGGGMSGVAFNGNPNPVPQNTWTGPGHVALSSIQGEQGRTHQMVRHQATKTGEIAKDKK